MEKVQTLFDKPFGAKQPQHALAQHPLFPEAQARLDERLEDVRKTFSNILDWEFASTLSSLPPGGGGSKNLGLQSKSIVFTGGGVSPSALSCTAPLPNPPRKGEGTPSPQPSHCDLITACLTLQTADDLRQELAAIYASLEQGGLFHGVLAGGQTLYELRTCLMEAEVALSGGASPRVHPLPDPETTGNYLVAAGFALPVVDQERVTLTYPDLFALMQDLRRYGFSNTLQARLRRFAPRDLFTRAQDIYAARFPAPDGGIAVTVDLIFLHGWKE